LIKRVSLVVVPPSSRGRAGFKDTLQKDDVNMIDEQKASTRHDLFQLLLTSQIIIRPSFRK
jgi:hypothetical protein